MVTQSGFDSLTSHINMTPVKIIIKQKQHNKIQAVQAIQALKETKPERVCNRSGCSNVLKKTQRRFCSMACVGLFSKEIGKIPPVKQTTYDPKYAMESVKEYIAWCEDEEKKFMLTGRTRLPKLEGFAHFIGIKTDTIREWRRLHPEFRDAIRFLIETQKDWLLDYGLSNKYNPAIAKLTLMTNHGMVEKKQSDNRTLIGVVKAVYGKVDELEALENADDNDNEDE